MASRIPFFANFASFAGYARSNEEPMTATDKSKQLTDESATANCDGSAALRPLVTVARTATPTRGRPFEKGVSGNPLGRPKRDHDIAELARKHSTDAIATLATIMLDASVSPSTRVVAANTLLDRGYGRAPLSLDLNHNVTLADEFEGLLRTLSSSRRTESC